MFDDAEDSSLPASLSPSKLVQSLEPLELEAACYEQLLFLASVRDDRLVCRHCSSRVVLSALFSLMLCGSPRLQRLVLLLLLAVLPSVPPTAPALHAAQVEAWATEGWRGGVWAVAAEATMTPDGAGRSDTDGCAILEVLFHIIGTVAGSCGIGDHTTAPRTQQQGVDSSLPLEQPSGPGSGALSLAMAQQCSAVVTKLSDAPLWRETVAVRLTVALHAADVAAMSLQPKSPGACQQHDSAHQQQLEVSMRAFRLGSAVLYSVGGFACVHSVGTRVHIEPSDTSIKDFLGKEGTIIRYEPSRTM
jgi:hypothetical protein